MGLFAKIKDWWTFRFLVKSFNKEVDENVRMYYSQVDATAEVVNDETIQQKYYNGITLMKRRLRQHMNGMNPSEYMNKFYRDGKLDLLALSRDEDEAKKALRKTKESIYIYHGTDVKTDADKTKMVDKRINHYGDLQKNVENRTLLRQARKAFQEGKLDEHEKLMKEWNSRYGKPRNSQTRY